MTSWHKEDDSMPLRELERLAGGRCRDCGRACLAHEAVCSIALGFKDAPRWLPCLARGLGREPADLRADLVAYVRRLECYARAWAAANRWRCRCMLKPEWAPPLDNVHPQKSQSFISAGIYIGLRVLVGGRDA